VERGGGRKWRKNFIRGKKDRGAEIGVRKKGNILEDRDQHGGKKTNVLRRKSEPSVMVKGRSNKRISFPPEGEGATIDRNGQEGKKMRKHKQKREEGEPVGPALRVGDGTKIILQEWACKFKGFNWEGGGRRKEGPGVPAEGKRLAF